MRSIPYPRRRAAISRLLPLFLLIGSTTLFGQSPGSSPLNSEEKRQILVQLLELKSCRAEVSAYEDHIRRERQLADRALENPLGAGGQYRMRCLSAQTSSQLRTPVLRHLPRQSGLLRFALIICSAEGSVTVSALATNSFVIGP